ncbi:T9SS type B sorting domain-containing protein [Flavobacterium sp. NKUCC04_CG]|uniref:T9SS type B sorting domain-containing protein n=1 Tax=Flavobacterium sp. NKUCC04_CG TaxID=2842121 RepID=UPI001C5B74CB|nr:T9SS type B sorting domain-containing protein [Flavobacterium sp. NKUCC04_CG]MBW3518211.1 T9SS type B sorting domain-containing protein [Flavobacterium sp. NKUCC04_CG]
MKQIIFLFLIFTSLFSFAQGGEDNTPYLMENRVIRTCSGIVYDSGGFNGNYSNDENITMTICPDVDGAFVRLDFTTFLLENNADFLTIFDGIGTGGQQIGLDPFTGTNSPGTVSALIGDGATGCLTLVFTSDDTNTAPGFSARITCAPPCQIMVPRIVQTSPDANPALGKVCEEDYGTVKICVGEEIFFTGAAEFSETAEGAKYMWDFKNGTRGLGQRVATSYDEPGAYRVSLIIEDPTGCRSDQVATVTVLVSTTKDVDFNLASDKLVYCLGEDIQLTAAPEMIAFPFVPTPPLAGTTWLPDGLGRVYNTSIKVDEYCADQVLEEEHMRDFKICINLEHSFTGDLDMWIQAPNGAITWLFRPAGGGNFFGHPIDDLVSGPGLGSTYCFTEAGATTIAGGQTEPTNINSPGRTYIPGDYLPIDNNFDALIGSPINGNWTLFIRDNLAQDDGYIFWWSVEFSDEQAPADLSFTPVADIKRWLPAEGLVNQGTTGNATVRPSAPGTYTYTYELVDDFDCAFTDSITVEVVGPVILGTPIDLNQCKDNIGNATFDLRDVESSLTVSNQFTFKYYGAEADAVANNLNTIPFAQTINIADGPKQIWVRVDQIGVVTPCALIETFKLIVNNCDLNLNPLPALQICESVNAVDNVFNLTLQTPRVFNNTPGYKVTYHLTQNDALNNQRPIIDQLTLAYPGTNGQVIYVRVQNEAIPTEFATTNFRLVIAPKPTVFPVGPTIGCPITPEKDLASFYLPLNNLALSGGLANVEISYYRNQLEAELGNPLTALPDTFISGPTIIWVRALNTTTGCYNVGPLELRIENLPALNQGLVIDYCDANNDGIGTFVLDAISTQILGRAMTPDLVITYHISSADASQNLRPLASPYNNNRPVEEMIYARVAFARSTCFEVVPVKLRVTQGPVIAQPTPLSSCVDVLGREVIYDLTTKIPEILNGLNPANYQVTFHVQQAHAENGVLPIDTPVSFSNAVAAVVYVRVEDINTGCYSVVFISLRSVLGPVIQPIANYTICDGEEGDGFAVFNLSDRIASITNGQLGLLVSFHANQNNAANNTGNLPANYQNIVAYNQTIYVRVQSTVSGCVVIKPMNLAVVALPVLNIPTTRVAICNSSANGQGTFDLLSLVEGLQNGIPGLDIHFYETQANAIEGLRVNRIPNPQEYNNLNPINPVVWVRANNFATGCFVVKPLYLVVTAAPIMPIRLDDIVQCTAIGTPDRGIFDLTVKTPVILAAQTLNDPGSLVVSYYLTEADAQIGLTRSITGPTAFRNTVNPQTIWVRVQNVDTKCYAIGSFVIKISNPLPLVQPNQIVVCQETLPNNGRHVFDLTQRELQILGGGLIFGTDFKYFLNRDDAERGNNAIPNPDGYTNISNPQTFWVVVTNREGCKSMVSLTVKVTPLPEPNLTPAALEVCEGEAGRGRGRFDLHLADADIKNHDNNLVLDYYTSEIEAIAGDEAGKIDFPEAYVSVSRTIWIRVSNQPTIGANTCFVIVPLKLIVNPVPFVNPLRPLMGCEEKTDGFYTFNLKDKYGEILNGRNANDFDIFYYHTRVLADEGIAVPMALIYTNMVEGEETIWVRLVNKKTGCFYVAPLRLKVEEAVFAFDIKTSPLIYCDDNDVVPVNDGFTRIDLTVNDADIIGTQNIPANQLRVVYFASEQDFLNNRPIADPTQFINTSSPQTIIAVVRYINPELFCEANVQFQVIVHKRPELLPIAGGYICEDLNSKEVTGFLIDTRLDSKLYNFIWRLNGGIIAGANLSYYNAKTPGTYTVSTTDKVTGCDSFNVITVVVTKIAPFSVTIDETVGNRDEMSEDGKQTIVVNVLDRNTPPGVYEFALDEGVYQNSNVFYDVTAGEHLVWVRDRLTGACAVSKLVSVMNYPKFFTPNGDGHNDTWNIKGLISQPDAKIYIFDRFGKLLKQVSPAGEGWDGTFGGRPVPSTDYWFTVEYNDLQGNRREFKGHFSLKR